jgi:hypothetical protein
MAHPQYHSCIEACVQCAQECEHCADACLKEADVSTLAERIRRDRDCAELCWTSAALMSRDSNFLDDLCRLCAEFCDLCGNECAKHDHDHCQSCAAACRHCAEECRRMAGVIV